MEHSLPSRESQQITDHLAKCADCREVVFLASAAVEESAGEEQELMPEVAVPRISPALQAKTADPGAQAGAGQAKEAIPESPRREWRWRWAWVPVAAAALLVSALLVQRSQFIKNAPQSSATIASKEPLSSATTSQPTSAVPPAPGISSEPRGAEASLEVCACAQQSSAAFRDFKCGRIQGRRATSI